MRSRFDKELNKLNMELTEMGHLVSKKITGAVSAFKHRDIKKAEEIFNGDDEVNEMERSIEEHALRLLLQQQPVASDLRLISSALKLITDMERIGDHAVDIAEITMILPDFKKDDSFDTVMKMGALSVEMVNESIKSFVTGDLSLVDNIKEHDDKVDEYFIEIREDVIDKIRSGETDPNYLVDVLMIAKYLERIGDHAENISEWVEFSITGKHGQE